MSLIGEADVDPSAFLERLVDGVSRVIPGAVNSGILTVERSRSLGDRLAGRAGTVTALRLATSSEAFSLTPTTGPRWAAEVARVSGGVIISRRAVPLGEWLSTFAGQVAALAADRAGDAAAAARALQALGVEQAGSDIRVDDATVELDLRALPARIAGRIPDAAAQVVSRIIESLVTTLERVTGSGEAETIVRRTATLYLPDTVRAYLSLPADWVAAHRFADGSTPEQAFIAQLATIEQAAERMRESALENDASALLANGRFLSSRFAISSLDLP